MTRSFQGMLIGSILGLSWLGMMIAHECGHVLAAWSAGETVERVVLHPLAFSRTDSTHRFHPLRVAWGGPILGAILPLLAFEVARRTRMPAGYLLRFFAGFCLVANGVYLGVGAFTGDGDAGDLLRFGSPRRSMVLFGMIAAPAGLALWHGLGPRFGLGVARGVVDRRAAVGTLALLIVVVAAELLLGSR